MQCPKCQFENRRGAKFCKKCGNKLELLCPSCGHPYQVDSIFCDECGENLNKTTEVALLKENDDDAKISESPPEEIIRVEIPAEGERKHVTVLFSDLTGYTAMSEKLDPEEVKEITSRIFGEVSKIVANYDGFIEKYAGDAVMAIFGVPNAHEDDPIRAIKAARQIHQLVDARSSEVEKKIRQPISMHTGINTGLVVTGEVNFEKGTHGIAGDTVNVASRLSGLGNAGDILIGRDTYLQSEGYFDFEDIGHSKIKGKDQPIRVYKVLGPKVQPVKIHRLHGLRSELIGRKVEMGVLTEAVQGLQDGNGSILSICGTAGTGKSRLIEEFRSTLNLEEVQWIEGHAYPFTQNIPYYLLINLLNRALLIEEGDALDKIREKIETGLSSLIGENSNFIPYIGSLYALSYPEIDDMDPEYWKSQLQKAVQAILSSVAKQGPTIICLEDLHWADPSFLELIRLILSDFREPIFFLCIYRPLIALFSSHQINTMVNPYKEIRLQDLSPSESHEMVESLLKTDIVPSELKQFVLDKVEGNPFYVEEMINSLIESETLLRDSEVWKITRPITESEISPTIHGVIAGRLDRLEKEAKQILQEASVIGRAFLYEILKRITQLQDHIDNSLNGLERLDLLRTRSVQPDLEYIFKHALTQEVVYNGLLKSERKVIHERIGLVMEQLFKDRLSDFYETLAFHFKQGQSVIKAVEYLIKSGQKSYSRYALEESHQYYREAYELLSSKDDRTKEEDQTIINLLIEWGHVHNCRADLIGLEKLLISNEKLAKSSGDMENLGMFYAWLGFILRGREKIRESYDYLIKALQLGEKISSKKIIGYSCAWLVWTCADMGLLDEGIAYGRRAGKLIEALKPDGDFIRFTLNGLGILHFYKGDRNEIHEFGEQLLQYGKRHSDLRCMATGHNCIGLSYYVTGNYALAKDSFYHSIQTSADILFSNAANLFLGMTLVANEEFEKAQVIFDKVMRKSTVYGLKFVGSAAQAFYGVILISQGNLNKGLKILEDAAETFFNIGSMYRYASVNFLIGKFYSRLATGGGKKSVSINVKNISFLIKKYPLASKKAEQHLDKAIEVAKKIGAKVILGQAYLELGLLHKVKKRHDQAKECISKAIKFFKLCKADVYLEHANEVLKSLE